MMAGLTLKNVFKRYENSGKKKNRQQNDYAVKDLNLVCEQGEFVAYDRRTGRYYKG